jgi:hypothetical protein
MKRILMTVLLGVALLILAGSALAQPNATWHWDGSWSFPVVPMHWTAPPAWLPDVLYGNEPTTHWNAAGINNGNAAIPAGMVTVMNLDGWPTDFVVWGELPAGTPFAAMNRGEMNVRGGRHVMSVFHDAWGAVAETDETDNYWGRQFVWSPLALNQSGPETRPEPPHPQGGWNELMVPATGNNCDGFMVPGNSPFNEWMVIEAHALDPAADYDLYLYNQTPIQDEGFSSPIAYSVAGAGNLDFLVFHQFQLGGDDLNLGVEKWAGAGDFAIEWISSWYLYIGGVQAETMAQGEVLKSWQMQVDPSQLGTMVVAADAEPGAQLNLVVFDPSFAVGGVHDVPVLAVSQPDGRLRLAYDFAVPGNYAVLVYRNPVAGTAPLDFNLQVQPLAADFAPGHIATWHSPLVPRPLDDGTPQAVPLPATLEGFSQSTYFNLAVTNNGPDTVEGVMTLSYMDGLRDEPEHSHMRSILGTLPAGGFLISNNDGPYTVPGGRHVWTLELDFNDVFLETDESNNHWGEQYVWSGPPLGYETQIYQNVAAFESDGWETVTDGQPLIANCNGYSLTDAPVGWWRAVAISHSPDEDLDLILYLPSTGPKNGFSDPLAASFLEGGYTDFVVVNENVGVTGDIDVGVYRFEGSTGDYGLDTRQSTIVWDPTAAPIGPVLLVDGEMIQIFDIFLDAETYTIHLDNLSGQVDWGVQLQPADLEYSGRMESEGAAFANGPGQGESFQVMITTPGWYGLVVYKSMVEDKLLTGTCQVRVTTEVSPAFDEVPPVKSGIAAITPNPFNPSTEIRFELGTAGRARLEVFDLQGARVRTLVIDDLPVGGHVVRWDGRDDQGRRAASGVYFARLRAPGVDSQQKMVMVK